jgi:hypothetical protein
MVFEPLREQGNLYVVNYDSNGVVTPIFPDPKKNETPFIRGEQTIDAQFFGTPGIERVYAFLSPNIIPNFLNFSKSIHMSGVFPSTKRDAATSPVLMAIASYEAKMPINEVLSASTGQSMSKSIGRIDRDAASSGESGGVYAYSQVSVLQQFPVQVFVMDWIHVSK